MSGLRGKTRSGARSAEVPTGGKSGLIEPEWSQDPSVPTVDGELRWKMVKAASMEPRPTTASDGDAGSTRLRTDGDERDA